MDDVMDFVNSNLNEVMDEQESHMRKVKKENSVFRKKLLEVLRNGENPESLKKVKKAIQANRVEQEPLIFNGKDLMTIKPTEENPQFLGEILHRNFLVQNKLANLLKSGWVGMLTVEIRELHATKNLRQFFQLCVRRNYSNDAEEAVIRAIIGANQYGAEMKSKYCL